MAKVVVADRLDPEAVVGLKMKYGSVAEQPADLAKELSDAEILIVRAKTKVTSELLSKAPKLKVVARAGIGLDNIDLHACEARGVRVVNTPDAGTIAVAELAVGLMLSLLRRIPEADAQMKEKNWKKGLLMGRELYGKTVGIVGFGRIGAAVAARLTPFGCKLIAFSPKFKGAPGVERVSLDELLKRADIVSLHAPLHDDTRGMISAGKIALMKPTAIIINTARGALVDEEALYAALKGKKLAGAALDVYSAEPYSGKLCELENVVLLPHLGADTTEGMARVGKQLMEKIEEAGL